MASRYWVGGTATWNATIGLKWALTSGGVGGQLDPTSADDVFFDANSGSGTCTLGFTGDCKNIDFTGYTGTFAWGVQLLQVASGGSFKAASGMTFTGTGTLVLGGGTITITMATNTLAAAFSFAANQTLTFGDNFIGTAALAPGAGGWVINGNNFNVKLPSFDNNNGGVRTGTLNMGSGIWEITGAGNNWNVDSAYVTLNASTSTLKFTDSTNADITPKFNISGSASNTYYRVWFARGASTGNIYWGDASTSTFDGIRDTGTAAHTLGFPNGKTQTISTAAQFLVSGSAGNLITLTSYNGNTATHTLSCASGIISCDYLAVSHSVATGGASFYAGANSTNNQATATSGSGWIFTAPPAGGFATKLLLMGTGK